MSYDVAAQYRDASNLNARIALHARFSTNPQGWMRWAFEQMRLALKDYIADLTATTKAKDLGSLVARQTEIASKFVEKQTQRQQAFARMATDAQARMAKVVEEAATTGRKAA